MCSILGIFEVEGDATGLRKLALSLSRLQRHRGPDWSSLFSCERALLAHERLAIVDIERGTDFLNDLSGIFAFALYDQAFEGYLPDNLWRQKEQFSDGVGYSWIDSLKAHAEREVSDSQMAHAAFRFTRNPPASKEAYLYRSIFETHFPTDAAVACVPEGPSIACSTPMAIAWDEAFAEMADPSGRAVRGVHSDSY